ncbi:unnamed protein product [Musa acuminata subsp. malaccensis]|uniref:(wild Malaysian banana) hypothetical protein n=1 Tax=Musa acuminata subsp. malaccensis TaxID=214687 RepID=A0A804JUI1_MUSAM|nr:unnamed protein product [Musa acuminata subsp. malaccensis]
MRDVDQRTGNDLLPMKKSYEDGAYRVNLANGDGGRMRRLGLLGILQ